MVGLKIDAQNTVARPFNTGRAAAKRSIHEVDIFNMSSNDEKERRQG